MSGLKKCPACGGDVAKSAKVCPHCGKKLKMGLFAKLGIGLVVLIALGWALAPSDKEKAQTQANALDVIANAQPSNLSPVELGAIFSPNSKYTDLQRDNKEKEITGQVVQWTLKVYDLKKLDEGKYKIQTQSSVNFGQSSEPVGAWVTIYTRSPEETQFVGGLQTDSLISFKGKITGVDFMRNIEIDPAILVGPGASAAPAKAAPQAEAPAQTPEQTPAAAQSAVELVTRLYKEFGNPPSTPALLGQPAPVLAKYLDKEFVSLVIAEGTRKCKEEDICGIDFEPLWGGQDTDIATLKIQATADPNIVAVHLDGQELQFELSQTADGLRIHDIQYKRGTSLRQILERKL